MFKSAMYRVMWSTGSGTMVGPRFVHYADALRFFEEKKEMASVVILNPNGKIARSYHRPRARMPAMEYSQPSARH